jgi:ArsR family transcriptional regulator
MNTFLQTVSALSDATRVQILAFIQKHRELCVCDIEKSFNMIQSRISRHLKILKDAGFLSVERRGRWAYYSISPSLEGFQAATLKEIASLDIELPKLQKGCSL